MELSKLHLLARIEDLLNFLTIYALGQIYINGTHGVFFRPKIKAYNVIAKVLLYIYKMMIKIALLKEEMVIKSAVVN